MSNILSLSDSLSRTRINTFCLKKVAFMMGNEDFGECSSSTSEKVEDVPLKKAKYVWQVKGKRHLKTAVQTQAEQPENDSSHNAETLAEQKRRISLAVDSNGEEILVKTVYNTDDTPVLADPKMEDYFIRKWQARQLARAYIDNTINCVMEACPSTPFDVEDFVDKCQQDGQVEDQGILMAIQAHGLQSNNSEDVPDLSLEEIVNRTVEQLGTANSARVLGPYRQFMRRAARRQQANLDQLSTDLMDTAVRCAIDHKGLSSFNQE